MIEASLQWAADAMGAIGNPSLLKESFRGVCTDTRDLKEGQLFFCLLGNRDGHDFAATAIKQGARALVIDQAHHEALHKSSPLPHLVVKDTLYALGELARAWRQKFSIPVIGLTGSNGKTTTKELLKALLDQQYQALATQGNFNNLIGVPKTLFGLDSHHEIAVVEMGMNDFGEIRRLTEISQPTLGLITNIGAAHLEKLGNLDGVAQAKGELFSGLNPEALAIVNMKDPYISKLATPAKKFCIGTPETKHWGEILPTDSPNPLPQRIKIHWEGEIQELQLALPGAHQLDNLLLAIACAKQFNVTWEHIRKGLNNFRTAPSRMEIAPLSEDRWLLDDCYNANPASTTAAIDTLAQMKARQPGMVILGDMNELGDQTVSGHRQIGKTVSQSGIEHLIAVGKFSSETRMGAMEGGMSSGQIQTFPQVESITHPEKIIPSEVRWILIKGSRTNHLEKLVALMKEKL